MKAQEPGESFGEVVTNYGISAEKIILLDLTIKDETSSFFVTALLPFLIPFLFIGAFIFFMMRQVQGANSKAMTFGQSTAKETDPDTKEKVSFKDIAGAKEAKEELEEARLPETEEKVGQAMVSAIQAIGGLEDRSFLLMIQDLSENDKNLQVRVAALITLAAWKP